MSVYSLSHLDDDTLMRQLRALIGGERAATAVLLAHIAEVDLRRLYLPAAYSSMYSYCVGFLGLSEGAAFRRVQSARAARRLPVLFDAIATGRLHLTAISMLAPHLRESNADELIAAATAQRTRSELQAWLARRFPAEGATLPAAQVRVVGIAPALPTRLVPLPLATAMPLGAGPEAAAASAPSTGPEYGGEMDHFVTNSPISGEVNWSRSGPSLRPEVRSEGLDHPRSEPAPAAKPYFLLKVALGEGTHAKLERAQVLLAHRVRVGEVAEVLDRALDALLTTLERRRGSADPVRAREPMERANRTNGRGIPLAIRREVWARDRGRCTFTSPTGHKCSTERGLEFDHVLPVARGGESTAENLRLRCRGHNQLEAERQFGRKFMESKRNGRGGRGDQEH